MRLDQGMSLDFAVAKAPDLAELSTPSSPHGLFPHELHHA